MLTACLSFMHIISETAITEHYGGVDSHEVGITGDLWQVIDMTVCFWSS